MTNKKTTKQRYTFLYNIHHWGEFEVDAHSYSKACQQGYDFLFDAFHYVGNSSPDGSEVYLEDIEAECDIPWPPEDWPNPKATCFYEIEGEEEEEECSSLRIVREVVE